MSETPTSVLVIDDEPAIVEAMEILLRKEGYAAHTATDGNEGISRMAALRPDIVISDVRMPTMSGLDVLAAARSLDSEMPVILMTAQATVPAAVQAVNDGAESNRFMPTSATRTTTARCRPRTRRRP